MELAKLEEFKEQLKMEIGIVENTRYQLNGYLHVLKKRLHDLENPTQALDTGDDNIEPEMATGIRGEI